MTIQNIDDIAFCIPTYNRPEECQDTIDRILVMWPRAHVYVADDSDDWYMHKDWKGFSHATTFRLPEDSGVSAKRNHLIEMTDEPFIFLLDDDMKVENIEIQNLVTILNGNDDIAVAAVRKLDKGKNRWSNSEGIFFIDGKRLFINRPQQKRMTDGVQWMQVDYAPMCFLARRKVFDHVDFDDRLKTCGEHVDFFLRLAVLDGHKQLAKRYMALERSEEVDVDDQPAEVMPTFDVNTFGVALDLESYVVDTGSRPGNSYNKKRARGGRFRRQMMAMWRFESIIRWNSRMKEKAIY